MGFILLQGNAVGRLTATAVSGALSRAEDRMFAAHRLEFWLDTRGRRTRSPNGVPFIAKTRNQQIPSNDAVVSEFPGVRFARVRLVRV